MVKITFIEHNGQRATIEADPGQSLMKAAVDNGIATIEAVCGGNCACGTCRVYVEAAWWDKLAPAEESEQEMIEYSSDPDPRVRLSCQIPITEELDGLEIALPESEI